jgi:hypothetical protein
MYRSIATTLLVTGFSTATLAAEPDLEGVTVGSPKYSPAAIVESAFNSCAKQFIAELFPDREVLVHTKLDQTTVRDFLRYPAASQMTFDMTARSVRTGALLARSQCTVNDDATVVHQEVRNKNKAAIAAIMPRDVEWKVARR